MAFAAALCLPAQAAEMREITLLEGPIEADWSDKNSVDPMQLAGVAAGDVIYVYTSNVKNGAKGFIRTKTNGWPAISPAYDSFTVTGDYSCELTESLIKQIKNQTLMFGGSGYTIEKITLQTTREEDTRVGYDDLCNPDASVATRQVYDLLRDCYGKKSISCSMAEVEWNYKEAGYVKAWTGKSDQWEAGAKWSYAMPWYHYQYKLGDNHSYANSDWWQDWFEQENVVTMNEMKDLKQQYMSMDPSGITEISGAVQENSEDIWYSISGMRVKAPTQPGLYINNGKKIILK